jgi:hypothetical protein
MEIEKKMEADKRYMPIARLREMVHKVRNFFHLVIPTLDSRRALMSSV